MGKETSNPVLRIIDGIEVRKTNKATISFNEDEWVRLIRVYKKNKGILSIAKIVALMSQACEKCGHDEITLTIPKSQLSKNRSFSGGTIKSYSNKDEQSTACDRKTD